MEIENILDNLSPEEVDKYEHEVMMSEITKRFFYLPLPEDYIVDQKYLETYNYSDKSYKNLFEHAILFPALLNKFGDNKESQYE